MLYGLLLDLICTEHYCDNSGKTQKHNDAFVHSEGCSLASCMGSYSPLSGSSSCFLSSVLVSPSASAWVSLVSLFSFPEGMLSEISISVLSPALSSISESLGSADSVTVARAASRSTGLFSCATTSCASSGFSASSST